MNLNDVKPLQPLTHGLVLIVGAKKSNFEEDLIDNPRVVLWDSQDEKWIHKDLPYNVRAVFVTRWIGHSSFAKILKEAKKKHITIFNPEGTGIIARQVRELLDIRRETKMTTPTEYKDTIIDTDVEKVPDKGTPQHRGKLKALIPFIDPNKNYADNAKFLLTKAQELGITSTFHSLSIFVSKQLKKKIRTQTQVRVKKSQTQTTRTRNQTDVSVEMLDNVIKELTDMRDYIVAVTEENQKLKARIDKFKKFLSGE